MERNTQHKMSGASNSSNNESSRGETSHFGSKPPYNTLNGIGVKIQDNWTMRGSIN